MGGSAAGLLFGLLPAWRAGAVAASGHRTAGAHGATTGRARQLVRRGLVVVQIALALTLLVGSGLAVRSFQRLAVVDPGFDPVDVLTFALALPPRAAALAGPVREAVRGLDLALPEFGVETLETRVGRARGKRAFVMVLLLVAAGLELLLGAVGLYGVVSCTVAQRRREIAIRMAVGAQVGDVRRLVLAEAGGLALVGVTLGVGAALGLTGELEAILFETSPLHPVVFVGVSGFLVRCVCWRAGGRRGGPFVSSL